MRYGTPRRAVTVYLERWATVSALTGLPNHQRTPSTEIQLQTILVMGRVILLFLPRAVVTKPVSISH